MSNNKQEAIREQLTFYKVLLNREGLDEFCSLMSKHHKINCVVSPDGDICYDIPKNSNINIVPVDFLVEIGKYIERLENKQSRLKMGGKRYQEIESEKEVVYYCSILLAKILNENK